MYIVVCDCINVKCVICHPVNRAFLKFIIPYILVSAVIPGKGSTGENWLQYVGERNIHPRPRYIGACYE